MKIEPTPTGVHAFRARSLNPSRCAWCGYERGSMAHSDRGEMLTNPDGSRTLAAPYRGQQPARSEPNGPLPDPWFD